MSVPQPFTAAETNLAECVLISQYAYERFIEVNPLFVFAHLAEWRLWYYHLIPDEVVLAFPAVRRIQVSGR